LPIDPTHQLVILARLAEFCEYRKHARQDSDPWEFMRRKLHETEHPLTKMKDALLAMTSGKLLEEMKAGPLDNERLADYKTLFERLLAPGDFADLAIHLQPGVEPKQMLASCAQVLNLVRAHNAFLEEAKPAGRRSPAWEKLVAELNGRIGIDELDKILARKPKTARRRAFVLRRMRRNVAEYCTVVRIPKDPHDTFTPFMLPRVEGLIAVCLRFLDKHR
jgi:hypothetical protein